MSDHTKNSLPSQVFEMAVQFVALRFRSEHFWCDDDRENQGDLGFLHVDFEKLRHAANTIASQLQSQSAIKNLRHFADTLGQFWLVFRQAWQGPSRASKLNEMQNVDPEFEYDRSRLLLQDSPLSDGSWDQVQQSADTVRRSFKPELRACFDIAVLLGSEVYPTFTGSATSPGARTRDAANELVYFAIDFNCRLQQKMEELTRFFPFLGGNSIDFSGLSEFQVNLEIGRLIKKISRLLKNPQDTPRYLGLVLDRQGERVGRNGRWEPFPRSNRWEVLMELVKFGSEVCRREALQKMLNGETSDALYKALSDIRRVVAPLGICVKSIRNDGYRLEEKGH